MILKSIFLLLISCSAYAGTFKICFENEDYYPYVYGDFESRSPGIIVEIIKSATSNLNIPITIYKSSWKRCLSDLKSGEADMTAAMIWTADRDSWARFPKKEGVLDKDKYLWKASYKLFKNFDSRLHWTGDKFSRSKISIAAPEGYVAYKMLKKMKVLSSDDYKLDQGLKMVARKRIDGYVVEELIGRHTVDVLKLRTKISVDKKAILNSTWYAPLSKNFYRKNQELSEKLFGEINRVRLEKKKYLIKKYIK